MRSAFVRRVVTTAIAVAVALAVPFAASAQVPVARNVEPVIVTGADLPSWSRLSSTIVCQPYPSGALSGDRDAHNGITAVPPDLRVGVPVDQIAAYRWDDVALAFVEIPVQVDEMYFYCLSNPPSDFAIYSGTDKELTYAWEVESWKKTGGVCSAAFPPGQATEPDPVPTLDNDDEIVFMASDAGPQAPLGATPPAGTTESQVVALTDPLNPADVSFVYLFLKPGGSSFDATNGYVSYVRDPDADEWIDRFSIKRDDPEILGVSNTGYGPNLFGTVCRTAVYPGYPNVPDGLPRDSSDRFVRDGITVSTDAYQFRATGRWMSREMRVAKPGQPGVYGPDLIDRWKGRAFQQSPDSTISLVGFEDEQVNWEANAATLGELTGPVRAIREVWGADSGTNVTKIEHFYRDAIATRYHVRVHPIPPDGLYSSWDYNAGVAVKYYNTLKPDGVDIDGINDDQGNVDGVGNFPAFFDAPDPTFSAPSAILNWEQVSGANDFGSLVYIIEIKGATSLLNPAVVPYYRDDKCLDDGTGDNPVPRPWPGEASTDQRVRDGYSAAAGGTPYEQLTCDQKQGAWGSHGVHFFVTHDTDNLASPEVLSEIDAQWWQFTVPTSEPTNVGQEHGNVVIAPLQLTTLNQSAAPDAPPSAGDVSATTDEDTPVDVTLTGLDFDTCELDFSIVTPPANGSLSAITDHACAFGAPNFDSATITYTPNGGFAGADSFTYTVNDGTQDSQPATVDITVNAEPTPIPTATPTATPIPTVTATFTPGGGDPTPTPTVTGTPVPTVEPTPSGLCGTSPAFFCKQPIAPKRSQIHWKQRAQEKNDKLLWKWTKGAATAKGDFGNPLTVTDYEVCVYDGNGSLIARSAVPADGTCRTNESRPCWRESRTGFTYVDRDLTPDGIQRVILRAGPDGKAKILVKGKGTNLPKPTLPIENLPITVELRNGNGDCWGAKYSTTFRNETDQVRAKSD